MRKHSWFLALFLCLSMFLFSTYNVVSIVADANSVQEDDNQNNDDSSDSEGVDYTDAPSDDGGGDTDAPSEDVADNPDDDGSGDVVDDPEDPTDDVDDVDNPDDGESDEDVDDPDAPSGEDPTEEEPTDEELNEEEEFLDENLLFEKELLEEELLEEEDIVKGVVSDKVTYSNDFISSIEKIIGRDYIVNVVKIFDLTAEDWSEGGKIRIADNGYDDDMLVFHWTGDSAERIGCEKDEGDLILSGFSSLSPVAYVTTEDAYSSVDELNAAFSGKNIMFSVNPDGYSALVDGTDILVIPYSTEGDGYMYYDFVSVGDDTVSNNDVIDPDYSGYILMKRYANSAEDALKSIDTSKIESYFTFSYDNVNECIVNYNIVEDDLGEECIYFYVKDGDDWTELRVNYARFKDFLSTYKGYMQSDSETDLSSLSIAASADVASSIGKKVTLTLNADGFNVVDTLGLASGVFQNNSNDIRVSLGGITNKSEMDSNNQSPSTTVGIRNLAVSGNTVTFTVPKNVTSGDYAYYMKVLSSDSSRVIYASAGSYSSGTTIEEEGVVVVENTPLPEISVGGFPTEVVYDGTLTEFRVYVSNVDSRVVFNGDDLGNGEYGSSFTATVAHNGNYTVVATSKYGRVATKEIEINFFTDFEPVYEDEVIMLDLVQSDGTLTQTGVEFTLWTWGMLLSLLGVLFLMEYKFKFIRTLISRKEVR